MGTSSFDESKLNRLGEEFAAALRRGESPTIESYCLRYASKHSEEIREFLDSIAMLEDLKGRTVETQRAETPPSEFGRYRVERCLGEGGMGSVYLAHDLQLDRKVALKTPKFSRMSRETLIERFYREARSAATLRHANLCPIYDVGEIDGTHYISMAYIEGRPLSDYLVSGKRSSVNSAVRIVRKVALALHEAHRHGVVHRDLKPANIMIDGHNEPIVMDFGLARQIGLVDEKTEACPDDGDTGNRDSLTRVGTIVGSPGYMSPEQFLGRHGTIGPETDVYSLGVVLFELLTGKLPITTDGGIEKLARAVLEGTPPDVTSVRPELSQRLSDICRRAMARHPEDRFQSMKEFSSALTHFLKHEAEGAKFSEIETVPSSSAFRQRARRHWRYSVVSASIAVLGAFAIAMVARSIPRKSMTIEPNATTDAAVEPGQESTPDDENELPLPQEMNAADDSPSSERPDGLPRLFDRASLASRLGRLDTNQDGAISRAELDRRRPEFGQLHRIALQFDVFDNSPRDGQLDREEIREMERVIRMRDARRRGSREVPRGRPPQ